MEIASIIMYYYSMEHDYVQQLRDEISALRKEVDALRRTQNEDFEFTHNLIKEVYTNSYKYIGDLHDYIWPMLHKLFPNIAETQKQVDAFLHRNKGSTQRGSKSS